jgi:hypothetical protein
LHKQQRSVFSLASSMSDLRKQIRDHYDAQTLSPEKKEAILAAGRAARDGQVVAFPERRSWKKRMPALVAAVVFLAAGLSWWGLRDHGPTVAYTALRPRLIAFFAQEPPLQEAPQDKGKVREWLVSQGAPAEMKLPTALLGLESAACAVVDVQGRKAYLSCYWREGKDHRGNGDLIHLLVTRASDFKNDLEPGKPVTAELDGWSFATWTKGDVMYTLAAAAPLGKVTPFISKHPAQQDEILRFMASVRP